MPHEIQSNENIPKAYSPKEYTFIGVIFSLIPVFVMSFSNAKVFANAEIIKKKMKNFLWIFLSLMVADYGTSVWALIHAMKGITRNITPYNYSAVMSGGYESIASFDVRFAKMIMQDGGAIFFVLNILLLIAVVEFTNRNELPVFNEMREAKKIQVHNMFLPVVIGIGFIIFQYTFNDQIVLAIAKMMVR